MEKRQQPVCPAYMEMVSKLNQAIFYCYNESSERLPVSIVNNFIFKDEKTVCFNITYFPLTEQIWNIFAAELHFYKKGIPFSVELQGIAVVHNAENNLILFSIQNAAYFTQERISDTRFLSSLFKPYFEFYRKGTVFFSNTFNMKTLANAFHKVSVHSDN
jgi:hypothetical protein